MAFRAVFRQILDSWSFGAFFRIFLTLPGLFRACSGLFWPLPGLFWSLPGFFWPLRVRFWPLFDFFLDSPKSPKLRGFQRRHFLFIKHCVSSIFPKFGAFLSETLYPVVFGRCAPVASLRLRLGPVKDNDRRRRCPSPRWDTWKTLELNPKMLELRVVLGWAVCYAQVRAAWVCTHASEHPWHNGRGHRRTVLNLQNCTRSNFSFW